MTTADAVRLESVARRFGRSWALRGVSLEMAAGECVVLLGRNGSGKTTLLRVLSTTLRPTRGGGSVFGHDLATDGDAVRGAVGMLGHDTGLYADLTARENLEFALRMRDAPRDAARIDGALERVELAGARDQRVRGFSAGMKRRLALARLMLLPPRLLLLDEPYAAFDASGIRVVHDFVRSILDAGGSALIATHDPDRAAVVADRWLRMQDGRVVALAGPPADAASASASPDLTAVAGGAR